MKRIITQDSPSYFLSVSEDHSVRSHDLRVPHTCALGSQSTSCPPPLIKLPYRLSTMATSPLTPWLFVVAGEMPLAYLFDRRMLGNTEERWGAPMDAPDGQGETGIRCVRRFGRTTRGPGERKGDAHVTGSRMAKSNGHELILCQFSRSVTTVHSRSFGFGTDHDQPIMLTQCTNSRFMMNQEALRPSDQHKHKPRSFHQVESGENSAPLDNNARGAAPLPMTEVGILHKT